MTAAHKFLSYLPSASGACATVPAPKPGPAIDTLRAQIRAAVEVQGIKAVAAGVGISHQGLRKFLDGSTPRQGTVRKLQTWFLRTAAERGDMSREGWTVALAFFLESVPEEDRADARAALVAAIRKIYTDRGIELPGWIIGD